MSPQICTLRQWRNGSSSIIMRVALWSRVDRGLDHWIMMLRGRDGVGVGMAWLSWNTRNVRAATRHAREILLDFLYIYFFVEILWRNHIAKHTELIWLFYLEVTSIIIQRSGMHFSIVDESKLLYFEKLSERILTKKSCTLNNIYLPIWTNILWRPHCGWKWKFIEGHDTI
jgi:hypothetical protein